MNPSTSSPYQPPVNLTSRILRQVADIAEAVGRLTVQTEAARLLRLRRSNRIRTIQGSLAIEGNPLSREQITAILEGKRVLAPARDIQEVRNAITAYNRFEDWLPYSETDLLEAHRLLMHGLLDDAGCYRSGGVGIMAGERVIHVAPPGPRVPILMRDVLHWLRITDQHPLIAAAVFHYEFEFIHPFADGNGRMGRLWQTLILFHWNPLFACIPVESLVHEHQDAYYQAIQDSTAQTDAAPFCTFMLQMIHEAILSAATPQDAPQVAPQVSPQVRRLLQILVTDMSREELQVALGLQDRKSFRERYLKPALADGLIEMTRPDTPSSRLQRYRRSERGRALI